MVTFAGGHPYVLVLNSYHKAQWSDSILNGISSVFPEDGTVEIAVEYMDTKTINTPEYLNSLFTVYSKKYQQKNIDVVIVSDDNALNFALEHHEFLFGNAPIVFCGVNRYNEEALSDHRNVTGVLEHGDFEATLKIATKLKPETNKVYVVCDRTKTGLINLEDFMQTVEKSFPSLGVELLQDLTYDELSEQLTRVPGGSLVFFISFWSDSSGRNITPNDLSMAFSEAAAPVFSRSEWMLGRNVVGGMCVHGYSQGEAAAKLAKRIIDGDDPSSIKVITDSPNKYIFDYKQLHKFGLNPALLPQGAILLNPPTPFYMIDKHLLISIALALITSLSLVVVLMVTIVRRRKIEKALRSSEQRYRTLVDNIEMGITLIDKNYKVVTTNATQVKFLDKPIGYFTGKYCFEEFEKRDRACEHCPGVIAMETGEMAMCEAQGIRDDGSKISVRIKAFPLKDEDGEMVGFIELVDDISEELRLKNDRKRLEDKMLQAQKLESLGILAGGIAHDFNNLLVGILGNADLALAKMPIESPGIPFIKKIITASERAADLSNQMLAYSGKGKFTVEVFDLNTLVKEITHLLSTVITKKGELQFELSDGMALVEGDSTQLRQVIMNLITNASDALGQKEGTIKIVTGVKEEKAGYKVRSKTFDDLPPGKYVFIEVCDTGSGMNKETREHIFDPFFSTKTSGRGLGLAAALGIVRGHNGAIEVYSGIGQGTTIKVLLPQASHKEFDKSPSTDDVSSILNSTEHQTVLLVDDDHSVLDVTSRVLQDKGYKILTAKDGLEALEVFRTMADTISIVVLDMTMPRMGGEEVFKELRKINPKVKVLLSSGYSEQDAVNRFTERGLAGFLQKPYRISALLKKIDEILKPGSS